MRVDLFDFELPHERIALRPARPRDSARLLLVEGDGISDHRVLELPDLLRPGDVLVFNDTKVIPAQLEGRRGDAKIGATLHKREGPREWRAFLRNAKRARDGDSIDFGQGVHASVVEKADEVPSSSISTAMSRLKSCSSGRGGCRCRLTSPPSAQRMRRTERTIRPCSRARKARSQRRPRRSISRPALLEALEAARDRARDADPARRRGHIPAGQGRRHDGHKMHAEWGRIDAATAERLNAVRAQAAG